MKDHWEDIRRESQQHFYTFHKDYIEPSVHFIEKEKKDADAKYAELEKIHTVMTNKCSDLERYNTLLQEKIESVENEMKSFSQVSMIAKWEKRLHDKSLECTRIQESLDKSIAFTHRLQQENILLNSRLEKDELLRQQQLCTTPAMIVPAETPNPDTEMTPPNRTVHKEVSIDVNEEPVASPKTDSSTGADTERTTAVRVPDEPEPEAPKATGADTERTTTVRVPDEPEPEAPKATEAEFEEPAPATEAEFEEPAPAPEAEFEEPAPAPEPKPEEPEPVSTVVADVEDTSRAIEVTYKVKMLKRSRQSIEKTKYLLGTDKLLYEWKDGDIAGEVVGQQLEKKGRNVFKFNK
jgi:hypothetical protein